MSLTTFKTPIPRQHFHGRTLKYSESTSPIAIITFIDEWNLYRAQDTITNYKLENRTTLSRTDVNNAIHNSTFEPTGFPLEYMFRNKFLC